jgi:5-amino-6-(5-phosphoribosylamino)uracil reductase
MRAARGQAPAPRIAVVSGSLSIDPAARLLAEADPGEGPLVLTTTAAPADRRANLAAAGAEVLDVPAGAGGAVDVAAALTVLGQRGAAVVLCEGGPTLNGQLVAADLVDEWCLTLGPVLVGGTSDRAAVGPPVGAPTGLHLDRVAAGDDGTCCLRYVRAPSGAD